MRWYSVEPRTRKYVKGYRFLSFARKSKKQLSDTRLDSLKIASKKVVHKAGEILWNKIADAVTKSNNDNIEKQESFEDMIISLKKGDEISMKSIITMKHYKISKLLNDSTVSKFVTKNGSK